MISRRSLLACGLLSSVWYLLMNVLCQALYPGYDPWSQTVSELSAIGSPTRVLWLSLGLVYALMAAAFGIGVWLAAGSSRRLGLAGIALTVHALIGIFWPPMHMRGAEFAFTDLLHIVWTFFTVPLMLAAVALAASALSRWFLAYSVLTILTMLVFGILTGVEGPELAANLPTPWIGLWERISIASYMIWVVVLSWIMISNSEIRRDSKIVRV